MRITGLVHRIKYAAVHRFQTVPQVWDGARDNHLIA